MEVVFDIRNKKDYEILGRSAHFWRIVRDKENQRKQFPFNIFFYKIDKKMVQ